MIITPHLLVGAAIGAKIKSIGWIIILGLLSHLILDKIPHWDYGENIENLPRNKNFIKAVFKMLFKMTLDGLLGLIILLFIIWQKNALKIEYLIFILVGISASLLPDFLLGIAKLASHKSKFSKNYLDFHEHTLHSPIPIFKPTLLGVGTEVFVSLIAILILIFS